MTAAAIPGGNFKLARKVFLSAIWDRPPIYFKIWTWIIGNANFEKREKNGFTYERGELVTTYEEIVQANSHHHNRSHIRPTIKQVRIILQWLTSEGMIAVEPLKPGPCLTGADTTARTRAYIGIKITVINYDTYQDLESYKGRHHGRDFSLQGHNNKKLQEKNTPPDLSELKSRYPNPDLIDQAVEAMASTRKSGRVAPSVVAKALEKWAKYPPWQVEAAIRVYLDKKCAAEGKDENYLLGIIRKQKPGGRQPATPEWF